MNKNIIQIIKEAEESRNKANDIMDKLDVIIKESREFRKQTKKDIKGYIKRLDFLPGYKKEIGDYI